jgi:hypothetical protein
MWRFFRKTATDSASLTQLRDKMTEEWFGSLKVGDTVHNYRLKWQDKRIVDKELREGVIKEIHDNGDFNRYVIVDNLTSGRQNKWNDYDLVKPQELQDVQDRLTQELSNYVSSTKLVNEPTEKTIDELAARAEYERLIESAEVLLKNPEVLKGKCIGIYGAFNKNTGECIYIGKSRTSISSRWREHARFWKKEKPIHRQPLLTQYLHFFSDQIEWRVILPFQEAIDNDMTEYCERRLFEKYEPIANTIIPNGTIFGRSIMEGEGESIRVSEWNPNLVTIKIHKGAFADFSDNKRHFEF